MFWPPNRLHNPPTLLGGILRRSFKEAISSRCNYFRPPKAAYNRLFRLVTYFPFLRLVTHFSAPRVRVKLYSLLWRQKRCQNAPKVEYMPLPKNNFRKLSDCFFLASQLFFEVRKFCRLQHLFTRPPAGSRPLTPKFQSLGCVIYNRLAGK